MAYDIAEKTQQFRINGFVVFEDLIAHETIDRIREAWIPVRDAGIVSQGENPPTRGWGRYNVPVPYKPPFLDEKIFEHPSLVTFLEEILGPDYVWFVFDSNIPMPGTDYQRWHRDGINSLYPEITTPCFQVGVKFPLCDTSEVNGSFEVMPCMQYVGDLPAENLDDIFGHGTDFKDNFNSRRLNLKKGSLWIHDNRVIHRGTPNHSDLPRDEICMAMSSSWVFSRWQHEHTEQHFSPDLWNSLSDHAKQVLRWQRLEE